MSHIQYRIMDNTLCILCKYKFSGMKKNQCKKREENQAKICCKYIVVLKQLSDSIIINFCLSFILQMRQDKTVLIF